MKTMFGIALALIAFAGSFSQIAAAGYWTLNGTIQNAVTCAPIAGAKVGSTFNYGTYNISNAKGHYNLLLGNGNWTVTVSDTGYTNGTYTTPYFSSGVYIHNFSLVPIGQSAPTKPCSQNTTVITSTTPSGYSTTTPTNTTNSTASGPSGSGSNSSALLIVGVIVVIVIIGAAIYMMKGKRGGKKEEHHPEHKTA